MGAFLPFMKTIMFSALEGEIMLKQSLCQLLSPSPQHLLGWAASLLKQDQGAQTLPLS